MATVRPFRQLPAPVTALTTEAMGGGMNIREAVREIRAGRLAGEKAFEQLTEADPLTMALGGILLTGLKAIAPAGIAGAAGFGAGYKVKKMLSHGEKTSEGKRVAKLKDVTIDALQKQKVTATLRREKGHDIDAACGQLRLKTERELAAR